jgi:hypothetical protein
MRGWIYGRHIWENLGFETKGGALDLHHGDQTPVDLWLHSLVAIGHMQCQQDRAQ